MSQPVHMGAHAGWTLDFRAGSPDGEELRAFGSADYHGSISVSRSGGLEPGTYTFVIEGMTSADFAALYEKKSDLVVNVHLYWRDRGNLALALDLAGLPAALSGAKPPSDSRVACVRVTALRRRAGARRYEVVIEARDWVYDRLLKPLDKEDAAKDPAEAIFVIAAHVMVTFTQELADLRFDTGEGEADKTKHIRTWEAGEKAVDRLAILGRALEQHANRHGLGMFLIEEDHVIFGPGRLDDAPTIDLTADQTIISIAEGAQEPEDPTFIAETPDQKPPPPRDTFDLTLRGNPDVRPGRFVTFTRPADLDAQGRLVEFTLGVDVGAASKNRDVTLYIRGVTHQLTRDRGFVTTARGVTVPIGDPRQTAWFRYSNPRPSEGGGGGSTSAEVLHELDRLALERSGRRAEVADVRATNVAGSDRRAQSVQIRRGLATSDGGRHASVRLGIDPQRNTVFADAPYATPFAFGKFGLVLPRYPGTRVLLVHRDGDPEDPIDVGALWTRGTAPASQPGDWWLTLPSEVPAANRASITGDGDATEPSGKASNDLIDADGNRVIEVGKLVVRVGRGLQGDAGARPDAAPSAAPVTIEHESGAKISIDQQGNVTVYAKKRLDLVAEQDITLDSKSNVILKVGGVVDVKRRSPP